ncbi:SHOCT domain-containing protein [Parapedobacter sp. DT-150]|uniref:SHOCT domain-containing protein n=1 Tax=Parapedobacter sp. DT-150 TaxID=3396162 RepID=UPI003F199417
METIKHEQLLLKKQEEQTEELKRIRDNPEPSVGFSVADELAKLKKLLDDGIITSDEFIEQKAKLLKI